MKLVLLGMATHAANGTHFMGSGYDLSDRCGLHWVTVYRNIKELVKDGYLEPVQEFKRKDRRKSIYRIRHETLIARQKGIEVPAPTLGVETGAAPDA